MNPLAIAFWLFCAGIGFLLNGMTGAVAGLVVGIGVSILSEIL